MERDNLPIGDVDLVVETIVKLRDEVGVARLGVQCNLPCLSQFQIMASLERLGTEAKPRVSRAPGGSARAPWGPNLSTGSA